METRTKVIAGAAAALFILPIVHESGAFENHDNPGTNTADWIGEHESKVAGAVISRFGDGISAAKGMISGSDNGQPEAATPSPTGDNSHNKFPKAGDFNHTKKPAHKEVHNKLSAARKAELQQLRCIQRMPLEQRVGQVLMIGVDGDNLNASKRVISKYHIGGALILGQPTGLSDGRIKRFKEAQPIPLLTATDEEGGPGPYTVQRLRSLGALPAPDKVPGMWTPAEAEKHIAAHAKLVHKAGVDMALAPLADVAPNHGRSAVAHRTFSKDPNVVTAYDRAYVKGWLSGGVLPTLKHFPGMGPAPYNTDFSPTNTSPIAQLRARDEKPYKALKNSGAAVMTGTPIIPGFSNGKPAAVSRKVVTGELRNRLGFDGLVITDDLATPAVPGRLSVSVREAIKSGNDIALIPKAPQNITMAGELQVVTKVLKNAVKSGYIPQKQLNESVARVYKAKHYACE